MTYDALKAKAGQATATIARIKLDKCHHTTEQSVIDGAVNAPSGIFSGFTGNFTISGGNALAFVNSSPYVLWDTELIRVNVLSNVQLDIIERGALGTFDGGHSGQDIKIMHSGEADGTCLGFPDGCSSDDSYNEADKVTFDFPNTQLQTNRIFYNGFDRVTYNPAIIDPGQSMGKRSGGSVTLKDGRDTDVYVPYPDRRSLQGTLFNKWLARHPNFSGRPIEILTGFDPLNFDESNFITRKYIIDTHSLNNGLMNFSYKDPLILTEDKKAKAPLSSSGVLTVIVDDLSTSITYAGAPAFDYGAAASTVLVRIDSEVIECTVASSFVLTIVNRATGGTTKADHTINSTIQKCLSYNNINVVDAIIDLMTNYTEISSDFFDDYTSIIASTSSVTLTAIISKPEAVYTLINELVKNGDLVMFYSETEHLIKIKAVKDGAAGVININEEDHIAMNSISVDENIKNQFTRYTVGWAANDATKTKGDEYFSIIYQSINLPQEQAKKKGEINEKKTFFNRWLTDSNDDVITGTSIAQRLIDRSNKAPEIFTFELDVESVFNTQNSIFDLGTIFNLSTSRRVNPDGSNKAENYQVISMKDLTTDKYEIKAKLFQDPVEGINVDFAINTNKISYDLSTEFAPPPGNYVVFINTGVEIGGAAQGIFAFTTGAQAAGVTFDFIIRGSILGGAAPGVRGGIVSAPDPIDADGDFSENGLSGITGGGAFEATVNCTINTGSGVIWAGGGSAAGERSNCVTIAPTTINALAGNGSCAGQGFATSPGGDAGTVTVTNYGVVSTGLNGKEGGRTSPGIQGTNRGGLWGEPGTDEGSVNGGLGGIAIKTNGNTVTITNGDNPVNIKGRRT